MFVIGGDGGKGKGKGKGKEGKELPSQEMLGLVDALLRFTQMTREDVSVPCRASGMAGIS